jgi:hypothetical protein
MQFYMEPPDLEPFSDLLSDLHTYAVSNSSDMHRLSPNISDGSVRL